MRSPMTHQDTQGQNLANMLVVEGGAMRSVFSAGLLDGFLRHHFDPFDGYLGVSAGASNLVYFLAGLEGQSLHWFLKAAKSRAFISRARFLRGGHLTDLRWLFDEIAASGLDLARIYRHGKPLLICTTDVATGEAMYADTGPDNLIDVLMASMALPLFYRDFPLIDGRAMTDGGMADAIPVREAIRRGARNIMVIRARPLDYVKRDTPVHRYIRWRLRHHPQLRRAMQARVQKHEQAVARLRTPPPGVRIVDVCPPSDFRMGRFSTRQQHLLDGYWTGLAMAKQVITRWQALPTA
jgi:predicted patatin/cPLA2 family phospholipase